MYGDNWEEDSSYWIFGVTNPTEDQRSLDDSMLRHLTDQDIYGLSDSYDDGRIDTLISAYVELRGRMLGLEK